MSSYGACLCSGNSVCLPVVGSTLDLRALSVVTGKTCWVLCIDALLLSINGSVLDALSIAVRVLLCPPCGVCSWC